MRKKGTLLLTIVLMILALSGVLVSLATLYEHELLVYEQTSGIQLESPFCASGAVFNCKKVIGSEYSSFFGIPLSNYGIFYYSLITVLSIAALFPSLLGPIVFADILLVFSAFASAFSVYLFIISKVTIGSLCPLCLATYGINFLMLLTSIVIGRGMPFIMRFSSGVKELLTVPMSFVNRAQPQKALGAWFLLLTLAGLVYGIGLVQSAIPKYILPAPDQADRIRKAITQAIEDWKSATPITFTPELSGSLDKDYSQGDPSAPISILEFSDYECPACRLLHKDLLPLMEKYKDKIFLVHKNYPLDQDCNPGITRPFHKYSCLAAYVARCAGEQNKFWEMSDYLFTFPEIEAPHSIPEMREVMLRGAAALGLDTVGLSECIDSGRAKQKILKDVQAGDGLGVAGTPAVWVNGKELKIRATPVLEGVFKQILDNKP